MSRLRKTSRLLMAMALLSLMVLGGWWSCTSPGPLAQETTVLIMKGASIGQIADQLKAQGVIRSASLFKLWARIQKVQLLRGEYTFEPNVSMAVVADKLTRGEVHFTDIVITPSMHAWSIQKRLQDFIPEDAFWGLWRNPLLAQIAGFPEAPSLEGLVAPATYKVHRAMEPEEIMLQMVEAFRDRVRPRLDGGLRSPYETLILASLAEKETSVREELPRVAGVFAHRLRIGMRLQCDPTSLYARWVSGDLRFTAPTSEDIRRPHPFNTYSTAGLPPTPIAIPSRAAINAAKAPLITKDLYFVATGEGGHHFASSLQAHNRNVKAFRKKVADQKRAKKAL